MAHCGRKWKIIWLIWVVYTWQWLEKLLQLASSTASSVPVNYSLEVDQMIHVIRDYTFIMWDIVHLKHLRYCALDSRPNHWPHWPMMRWVKMGPTGCQLDKCGNSSIARYWWNSLKKIYDTWNIVEYSSDNFFFWRVKIIHHYQSLISTGEKHSCKYYIVIPSYLVSSSTSVGVQQFGATSGQSICLILPHISINLLSSSK